VLSVPKARTGQGGMARDTGIRAAAVVIAVGGVSVGYAKKFIKLLEVLFMKYGKSTTNFGLDSAASIWTKFNEMTTVLKSKGFKINRYFFHAPDEAMAYKEYCQLGKETAEVFWFDDFLCPIEFVPDGVAVSHDFEEENTLVIWKYREGLTCDQLMDERAIMADRLLEWAKGLQEYKWFSRGKTYNHLKRTFTDEDYIDFSELPYSCQCESEAPQ